MTINSQHLRQLFLDFFAQHGHFVEKSAPLIPHDDPTLLFVNAGMVQFKNVFTKKERRDYTRAATSQKCVRAGGKHNDLENVGQTARHHTFFEMLGNFSFGDYFKEEAISLAWKFLTEVVKLDKNRLSVSVFAGDEQVPADTEAEKIWHEKIGIPKERIKHLGRADNFWQMGDTGPCGPCTEIHYDRSGIEAGFGNEDLDDQNVEIWNLVFMQYEQLADGTLKPLPAPCVDTGMGLERLCTVVNGLGSNYDSDLLKPLVLKAQELCKKSYQSSNSPDDMAMRVIADHARATSFLIADGLFPSNEGRGYVLRRIMRRAIRHGAHLGLSEVFFHLVCLEVIEQMGGVYPELKEAQKIIEKVVLQEEEAFRKTLDRGLQLFDQKTKNLNQGDALSGELVFRLHETYGFPADLTEDLAKEKGLKIEWESFKQAQKEHEERSSQGLGLKGIDDLFLQLADKYGKTLFQNQKYLENIEVLDLIADGQSLGSLKPDQLGIAVLKQSPFYGESGGQIGDTGKLLAQNFEAQVLDTKKVSGLHLHFVKIVKGELKKGQKISGLVDWERRQEIMRNHSATHLLHAALREVLGSHVTQKGSLVAEDRLRFDFSHFEPLSLKELNKIEYLVNSWILSNEEAKVQEMSMDEAKAYGALALFGEKYESKVRVLDMGSHSIELCGGTHCSRTGDIGQFRIISEGALAQGIRRMEAVSGFGALKLGQNRDESLKQCSKNLHCGIDEVPARIEALLEQNAKANQQAKAQNQSSIKELADSLAKKAQNIGSQKLVCEELDRDLNPEDLRQLADFIRDSINSGVVALGLKLNEQKCSILVACTKDLSTKIHAGKLVSAAAQDIGGKGGGRPDFAQAGGNTPTSLAKALSNISESIKKSL